MFFQATETTFSLLDTLVLDSTEINSTLISQSTSALGATSCNLTVPKCSRCSDSKENWVPESELRNLELGLQVSSWRLYAMLYIYIYIYIVGNRRLLWFMFFAFLVMKTSGILFFGPSFRQLARKASSVGKKIYIYVYINGFVSTRSTKNRKSFFFQISKSLYYLWALFWCYS